MLPKETWVYLPIAPSSKDKGAWELWDEHQKLQKPKLARKPAKALVPILLQEDLQLQIDTSDSIVYLFAFNKFCLHTFPFRTKDFLKFFFNEVLFIFFEIVCLC